ncbi:hypothetical protein GCM10009832_25170 [Dietzia kunjamensis subsp. schimae]
MSLLPEHADRATAEARAMAIRAGTDRRRREILVMTTDQTTQARLT